VAVPNSPSGGGPLVAAEPRSQQLGKDPTHRQVFGVTGVGMLLWLPNRGRGRLVGGTRSGIGLLAGGCGSGRVTVLRFGPGEFREPGRPG